MNKLAAHAIDDLIELTLGSLRLIASPPQYHFADRDLSDGFIGNPEVIYAIPPQPPQLQFDAVHRWFDGRTRSRYRFTSRFLSPYPANNTVHGEADLHPEGSARAAVIFLHGYQMNSFAPLKWFAEDTAHSGVDIYYMSLPYHLRRAPQGTWSGMYALSADVERTVQSFRQGVLDLRSLITYVKTVKKQKVALAGISLGAFTSCMASVVDERPDALVSILGGASLADMIWAGFSFRLIRSELRESGVLRANLEDWWRIMAPGVWRSRLAKEQMLMIAGEHDPIITPGNVTRLWEAWNEPLIHWHPCGHASAGLYAREIGAQIKQFLNQVL
jgi:hypothetical protein